MNRLVLPLLVCLGLVSCAAVVAEQKATDPASETLRYRLVTVASGLEFPWSFAFLPDGRDYRVLGTDGFGRSDSRRQLRRHFEVDAAHVAYTALLALHDSGDVSTDKLLAARKRWGINPEQPSAAKA